MKKAIAALVAAAILILVPYFVMDGENRELDDAARSDLPGGFVRLTDGQTWYRLDGPENGPPVVLIHGYSIPSFLWDDVAGDLIKAGSRVLRYDMYGRGFSDRPHAVYNPEMFDRQLTELLDALKMKGPVDLAGISMGGAVSVWFTQHHPERVRRLVLISPFGFPQKLGFMAELIKTPVLGDYLMAVAGDRVFQGRLPQNFHQPKDFPAIEQKFLDQMRIKGYKRALLSTMRYLMPLDFTESFQAVGREKKPVLLIWGKQDQVVPFAYNEKVRAAIPQAEFVAFEDRGHVPLLEKPELVSEQIIRFLN